jgi:arginine/lysine/ornithine decarboxylase
LITTTSPSALLYGSIDGFRRRMVLEGRHLLDEALERTARIRDRLHGVPGLTVMDDSVIGHDSVAEWDPAEAQRRRLGARRHRLPGADLAAPSTDSWLSSATPAGSCAP